MKKAQKTMYRSVSVDADHPLSQSLSKCRRYAKAYVHRLVLYEKIGPGEHACHWCSKLISWDNKRGPLRLMADHVDGDKWNNTPDNLVPACWRCNGRRAVQPNFLTHCKNGHEWTPENTYIRPDGDGRQCIACNGLRSNQRYHTKRRAAGFERKKLWREIVPEDVLRRLYVDERKPIDIICKELDTCVFTVYKAIKGYSIPRRRDELANRTYVQM